MTTPDNPPVRQAGLASLIAAMPHLQLERGEHSSHCTRCKLEDALDALAEKLTAKWSNANSDDYYDVGEALDRCADDLLAELRGRGADKP